MYAVTFAPDGKTLATAGSERAGWRPEIAAERTSHTWAAFLRLQADAILAADFIEAPTLTGTRMYVLAVIEHASRRVRILGAAAHPTAAWVTQAARNLAMDLQDEGRRARFLIRDRDGKYPPLFDTILADTGIKVVLSGVKDAPHERDHGTVDSKLPRRTAGPHVDLEPRAAAARAAPV
jgi:putative transposase